MVNSLEDKASAVVGNCIKVQIGFTWRSFAFPLFLWGILFHSICNWAPLWGHSLLRVRSPLDKYIPSIAIEFIEWYLLLSMRSLIIILIATYNSLTASYTIWDSSLQRIQCFECVECRSFDLSVLRVFLSDEAQRKSYLFYIHQPTTRSGTPDGWRSLIPHRYANKLDGGNCLRRKQKKWTRTLY